MNAADRRAHRRRPAAPRAAARALGLAVALAAALRPGAAPLPVAAQSPFPARDGVVANATDLALSTARVDGEFAAALGEPYDLGGLFLIVPDCRPDPEVYLDRALVHYGLADAAGRLDDRTLAWLVCTETPRYAGFFWGDGNPYADRLSSDPVVAVMVEQLRAGNVTGAVVDGIETAATAIGLGAAGAPPSGGDAAPEPAHGPFGEVPSWAILAAGGIGGLWWWRRRRRAPAVAGGGDAADATATADPLADALRDLDARLVEDPPALARLILLYQPLGDAAMLALRARHEAMRRRAADLRARAAGLAPPVRAGANGADASAPAPGTPEARAAAAAAAAYRAALDEARGLLAYVDGLPEEADHAERLVERAAILVVEAREAIDEAARAYDAARVDPALADEALPEAGAALAFPRLLVTRAEAALAEGRRLAAGEMAEDAAELAGKVAAVATEMAAAEADIARAAVDFGRVDDYAESSWADIRGNGSEAEESLDAAAVLWRELVAHDPAGFGDDPAVGFATGLARVAAEIARARALAAAVGERLGRIREARDGADALLGALANEIAEARAWLARPEVGPEVGAAPGAAIDAVASDLDALRAAAGAAGPDWLEIRRRLHAADAAIDAALGDARARRERVAALRRQVETARQEAAASLEKAERYLAFHARDVGGDADAQLAEARAARGRVLEVERGLEGGAGALDDGLRAALDGWHAVDAAADAAYEAAAGDVRRAENQRAAHRPRSEWLGPVVPLPVPPRPWRGGGIFDGPFGGSGGFGGFGGPTISIGGPPSRPPRPGAWGGGSGGGGSRGGGFGRRRGGGTGW